MFYINLITKEQNQPDPRFEEFFYLPFEIETKGKSGFFGNFGNIRISTFKLIEDIDGFGNKQREFGFGNIDVHKNDIYWKPWFSKETDNFDILSILLDGGVEQPYKLSMTLFPHLYETVYSKQTEKLNHKIYKVPFYFDFSNLNPYYKNKDNKLGFNHIEMIEYDGLVSFHVVNPYRNENRLKRIITFENERGDNLEIKESEKNTIDKIRDINNFHVSNELINFNFNN